jgi:hypothetical protein
MKEFKLKIVYKMVRDGSTAVQNSPHHPKVKGLSQACGGTGREKMAQKIQFQNS